MGALSNKGGRGQRNREEIGAVFILLAASPLVRPARQNHHATQATPGLVSYRGLMQNFRQASQPLSYAESPPGLFTVISNALQRESEIKCYAARCILFFVDSAKSLSALWSEEGNIKNIEKGVNDCSKI